jgi:hypothetical protein
MTTSGTLGAYAEPPLGAEVPVGGVRSTTKERSEAWIFDLNSW